MKDINLQEFFTRTIESEGNEADAVVAFIKNGDRIAIAATGMGTNLDNPNAASIAATMRRFLATNMRTASAIATLTEAAGFRHIKQTGYKVVHYNEPDPENQQKAPTPDDDNDANDRGKLLRKALWCILDSMVDEAEKSSREE